jgi:hypothetical protein
MDLKLAVLSFLLVGCAHAQAERPTQTGDVIGSATMLPDGSIEMTLRSVECSGMIVHGAFAVRPSDPGYEATLKRFAPMKPGDTKPVTAGETAACPRQ